MIRIGFAIRDRFLVSLLSLFFAFGLGACKGGELCGPGSDPVEDADGDCVENTSDNCPLDFNGGQVDLDEDGVGQPCDADDGDDTIALVTDLPTSAMPSLTVPDFSLAGYVEPQAKERGRKAGLGPASESCEYHLIACNGRFLGLLNADADEEFSIANEIGLYGSAGSDASILNPLGFYGRGFTSCSAFNESAPLPPAVVCQNASGSEVVGYLTLNPTIEKRIPACDVLAELGLTHPACE